jgi:hypothetical protein
LFWLGLCSRAIGFDTERDVYDAKGQYNAAPPKISLISRYKNIIWTYSSSTRDGAWDDVVNFTPESLIGTNTQVTVNYLSLFLAKGGHVLTEGNSEQSGGLASCLLTSNRIFPTNLKCEITGNTDGCEGDTSGVNTYAYKDYCVTMLDKIIGAFRTDSDMPVRRARNYDCMTDGYKTNDPWNKLIPGMPDRLSLSDDITAPGRFFDPNACSDPNSSRPCGFTLVEVYDPFYWMDRNIVTSQSCFHPMYRMHAKSTYSKLDTSAVALYVTKYAHITPEAISGINVAAPSFHFGFELWYFRPSQVDSIINTVLGEWQILATQ